MSFIAAATLKTISREKKQTFQIHILFSAAPFEQGQTGRIWFGGRGQCGGGRGQRLGDGGGASNNFLRINFPPEVEKKRLKRPRCCCCRATMSRERTPVAPPHGDGRKVPPSFCS